ncbi:MAG TPA: hypothetical protein VIG06_15870 [Kofleriaceae bacterium]|jgi:hypothetical protein
MRHLLKTTVIYVCLVGPPFAGLIGIIHVGKRITPPRSIGGEWQLDDVSRQEAAEPCHGIVFEKQPTVKVSQSGLRAEVLFADKAKTKLGVEIEDDRIHGSGGMATTSCDQPVTLEARLDRTGGEPRIVGTLERRGCSGCPVAHLRAARPAAETP